MSTLSERIERAKREYVEAKRRCNEDEMEECENEVAICEYLLKTSPLDIIRNLNFANTEGINGYSQKADSLVRIVDNDMVVTFKCYAYDIITIPLPLDGSVQEFFRAEYARQLQLKEQGFED